MFDRKTIRKKLTNPENKKEYKIFIISGNGSSSKTRNEYNSFISNHMDWIEEKIE